jgi:hypothetical protein
LILEETMRKLNKAALDIVSAIQALQSFAIRDASVTGKNKDWMKACRDYYVRIPDQLMREAGLVKNEYDFRLALDFQVSEEMQRTAYFLLDKFDLDTKR